MIKFKYFIILYFGLLTACTSQESRYQQKQDGMPVNLKDISHVKNAIPQYQAKSQYGNPKSYTVRGKTYYVLKSAHDFKQQGIASWYGNKFHGHKTSNGEIYDMYQMTAAHKTLPLPTYVEVTNLKNNKKIIVRVNDRGPFYTGRIIDLSYVAAKKLGITKSGTGQVKITAINIANKQQQSHYIQVGAYSNKQNALRQKNKIKQLINQPVLIKTAYKNKKAIYRVQIKSKGNIQTITKQLYQHQIKYSLIK